MVWTGFEKQIEEIIKKISKVLTSYSEQPKRWDVDGKFKHKTN